jgi:hypothetical protein
MIAPLFTETAIVPLQYRRIDLALRYLAYLVSLPANHLARAAVLDSCMLSTSSHSSWITDLWFVLLNLPIPISVPDLTQINGDGIKLLQSTVVASMKDWLNKEMMSPKMYLLQGRLELEEDKAPVPKTLHFRHYLRVMTVSHRKSLTRLLLSDHGLAVEQLRRIHGPHVPREQRLCRFCLNAVESPEHALLECTASHELVRLRNAFVQRMQVEMPVFLSGFAPQGALLCLKALIANRTTIALLAKYTHDVLQIFDAHAIYNPFL